MRQEKKFSGGADVRGSLNPLEAEHPAGLEAPRLARTEGDVVVTMHSQQHQHRALGARFAALIGLCLLPLIVSANDILGTNIGVVATDAGVVQVPCNLVGTGPLRYPPKARRYKYIGQVIVKFGLDQQGRVTDPYVVASEPPGVFERAALQHIKSYKYQPPLIDGAPTHVDEVAIKLVFDPNRR